MSKESMAYLKQLHSPEGPAVCESSCFKFVFVELNLLKFIISSYSEFSSLRKLHYKHVNIRSNFKGTVGVFSSDFSFVKGIVRLKREPFNSFTYPQKRL